MDPQRTTPDDDQALQEQIQLLADRIRLLEAAIERVDVELSVRPQRFFALRVLKLITLTAVITTLTTRLILTLSTKANVSSWLVAILIGNGITILIIIALALALFSSTESRRDHVEQVLVTLGVTVPKSKESRLDNTVINKVLALTTIASIVAFPFIISLLLRVTAPDSDPDTNDWQFIYSRVVIAWVIAISIALLFTSVVFHRMRTIYPDVPEVE